MAGAARVLETKDPGLKARLRLRDFHGLKPVASTVAPLCGAWNFQGWDGASEAVILRRPGGLGSLRCLDFSERANDAVSMRRVCPRDWKPGVPARRVRRDLSGGSTASRSVATIQVKANLS